MKYPNIKVKIIGTDGNGFAIISKVRRALQQAKVESVEIDSFTKQAMSGDYDNLLRTCLCWVDVR